MQIVPCPTIDGSSFVQLDEKGYNHYFNPHKQGLTSMLIFKIPGCAGLWNFSGGSCWAFRATKTHQETPFLITNVSWEPYVPNIPPKNPIPYTYLPYVPFNQPGVGGFVPTSLTKKKSSEMLEIKTIGSEAWKAKNMWVVFFWGGIHVAYHPKVRYTYVPIHLFNVDVGKYTKYMDPSWVLLWQKTCRPIPFNPCQVWKNLLGWIFWPIRFRDVRGSINPMYWGWSSHLFQGNPWVYRGPYYQKVDEFIPDP